MTRHKSIPIRNIFYMLSYAYNTLHLSEYQQIGTEKFDHVKELYARILSVGLPVLIRGGLSKDYISLEETSNVVKGKIDVNATIKQNTLINKKLAIVYDELSEDILFNQIIKATLVYITRSPQLSRATRRQFYGLLPYFEQVSDVELDLRLWKQVRYNRQNIRYQFVIDICRYFYEALLFDDNEATHTTKDPIDKKRLATLYEKFLLAFFKRESPYKVSSPHIKWDVDDGIVDALPNMETDLVLQNGEKTFIIDAKLYSDNMSDRFKNGKPKQLSNNLYQLFAYLENWQRKENEVLAGMLLYAETKAEIQPSHQYKMKGKQIFIEALDLNQDFAGIKQDLLAYTARFLE